MSFGRIVNQYDFKVMFFFYHRNGLLQTFKDIQKTCLGRCKSFVSIKNQKYMLDLKHVGKTHFGCVGVKSSQHKVFNKAPECSSNQQQKRLFHTLNNLQRNEFDRKLVDIPKEIHISKRFIKKKTGFQKKKKDFVDESEEEFSTDEEDEEEFSSDEDDDELLSDADVSTFDKFDKDSHISTPHKQIECHLETPRSDAVLRKALNMSSREVQEKFFAGQIYLNDKKLLKKSRRMWDGDYVDVVTKTEEDVKKMKRVRLLKTLKEKTRSGKTSIICRVWKQPYEVKKEDDE